MVQEEEAVLASLEEAARQLDLEGRGELTNEELCSAVNQQDQLQTSLEEVNEYNIVLAPMVLRTTLTELFFY